MVSKDSMTWLDKYQPVKSGDIIAQDTGIKQLKNFIENFKSQRKKSALIYGPSGCGKTSAAYAIAKELNLEVVELNASDFRKADDITSVLGAASKQMSLFSRGKMLLVEEVDGISGQKDRGGVPAIEKMIKGSAFPVIITSNDPFNKKFSKLRTASVMVEFEGLKYSDIFTILESIATKENVKFDENALRSIARRAGGDARAAVTDFQILSVGRDTLTMESLEDLSPREQEESIINALTRVFKTTDFNLAINAFDAVPEDLDKVMLWVDENLPKEYDKPEDLASAYDYLSKADVMKRRIRRWQHWRFLVYINAYLSAGVATSKTEKYKKHVDYKQTMRLLKIWQANMKYARRKVISEKFASKTHTSTKFAIKKMYPYMVEIFKHDAVMSAKITADFELTSEEQAYLRK